MITYKTGNIFDENVEALVNPVNCVGVMGKGLALEFKKRFPKNFESYKTECLHNRMKIGIMSISVINKTQYMICFPTKTHWKNTSKLEYIEKGLKDLKTLIISWRLKSIAIPALGCGLGGLQWKDVRLLIEKYLNNIDCEIIVFEPK